MLTCLYVVNQEQSAEKVKMASSNAILIQEKCICITLSGTQEVKLLCLLLLYEKLWKKVVQMCIGPVKAFDKPLCCHFGLAGF